MAGLLDSLRDFADTDQTDALPLVIRFGTVTAIASGAASDGNDQLTVSVNGSTQYAPYLASYTSRTVGDVVAVALIAGSPLILGKRIGAPSF